MLAAAQSFVLAAGCPGVRHQHGRRIASNRFGIGPEKPRAGPCPGSAAAPDRELRPRHPRPYSLTKSRIPDRDGPFRTKLVRPAISSSSVAISRADRLVLAYRRFELCAIVSSFLHSFLSSLPTNRDHVLNRERHRSRLKAAPAFLLRWCLPVTNKNFWSRHYWIRRRKCGAKPVVFRLSPCE